MKTAKRLLSVLLILVMVAALVACGGDDTTTDTNTGSQDVQKPTTNTNTNTSGGTENPGGTEGPEEPAWKKWVQKELSEEDKAAFAGKNYVIIQHSQPEDPFGYSQDSLMGASVADRIVQVQDKYGCTFTFEYVAYGSTDFVSAIQAKQFAENAGDLLYINNNASVRRVLGTGGDSSLMVDLLAMDDIINFWNTDKWGNISCRETMMAGGTFYGVSPALWTDATPLPFYQVVYNRAMIVDDFGATDPQEYWENEAWDRDAMLDVIEACYDDSMGEPIVGMVGGPVHMVRATYLTCGQPLAVIKSINQDETVDWECGLLSPDAIEALTWLKTALTTHAKNIIINDSWSNHEKVAAGQAAMAVTRPQGILNSSTSIVTTMENFGLTTWAGADANVLSGYYENCTSISIPLFAQDWNQSAYLMYDLFEGMDGIETYDDVLKYYRDTYFETDLDMTMLVRPGTEFQYSYWPNGCDSVWSSINANNLLSASSVKTLIEKAAATTTAGIEEHMVPNKVALEKYRQNGFFE